MVFCTYRTRHSQKARPYGLPFLLFGLTFFLLSELFEPPEKWELWRACTFFGTAMLYSQGVWFYLEAALNRCPLIGKRAWRKEVLVRLTSGRLNILAVSSPWRLVYLKQFQAFCKQAQFPVPSFNDVSNTLIPAVSPPTVEARLLKLSQHRLDKFPDPRRTTRFFGI